MKKLFYVGILVLYCLFLTGCYTARTLSKVGTGRVSFGDVWDSLVTDDLKFQERYW